MGLLKTVALFGAIAVISVGFSACSSVTLPTSQIASHEDEVRNIPVIDNMIVSLKQEYINKCYAPVIHKNPPTTKCQTDLFQQLERRYHSNFSQDQVNHASDDLFFKDVNERLASMSKKDPAVREAIRQGAFRSQDEMFAYYKSKYSFVN